MTTIDISVRVATKAAAIPSSDLEVLEDVVVSGNGRPDIARDRGVFGGDETAARPSAPPAIERAELDEVDLAGMDSFPASDPPAFWTRDPAPRC